MPTVELRSDFNSSIYRKMWVGCPNTSHMAQCGDSRCVVGLSTLFPLLSVFLVVIIGFAMEISFAGMFMIV